MLRKNAGEAKQHRAEIFTTFSKALLLSFFKIIYRDRKRVSWADDSMSLSDEFPLMEDCRENGLSAAAS